MKKSTIVIISIFVLTLFSCNKPIEKDFTDLYVNNFIRTREISIQQEILLRKLYLEITNDSCNCYQLDIESIRAINNTYREKINIISYIEGLSQQLDNDCQTNPNKYTDQSVSNTFLKSNKARYEKLFEILATSNNTEISGNAVEISLKSMDYSYGIMLDQKPKVWMDYHFKDKNPLEIMTQLELFKIDIADEAYQTIKNITGIKDDYWGNFSVTQSQYTDIIWE